MPRSQGCSWGQGTVAGDGGRWQGTVAGDGGGGGQWQGMWGMAGDSGRGRLHLGAAARRGRLWCGQRCSHCAGLAHPYQLPVLPGGERCCALLITWPLIFIAASLARARGEPVTQVIYALGHESPGMGGMGSPGEVECPQPAVTAQSRDGTGMSPALRFAPWSTTASCAVGLGLGIHKGWGHRDPLLPLCRAGDRRDGAV